MLGKTARGLMGGWIAGSALKRGFAKTLKALRVKGCGDLEGLNKGLLRVAAQKVWRVCQKLCSNGCCARRLASALSPALKGWNSWKQVDADLIQNNAYGFHWP